MRPHLAWWGALTVGLLCQTSIFPGVLSPLWTPDSTKALTLWLALTGLPRGGVPLAFFAGLGLDIVSGAPLGFGAALRLGLYALARPFRGVFFENRPILLLPFGAFAAIVDSAGAGVLSWLVLPAPFSPEILLRTGWHQALVDLVWVPGVFVALELLSGRSHPREVRA